MGRLDAFGAAMPGFSNLHMPYALPAAANIADAASAESSYSCNFACATNLSYLPVALISSMLVLAGRSYAAWIQE